MSLFVYFLKKITLCRSRVFSCGLRFSMSGLICLVLLSGIFSNPAAASSQLGETLIGVAGSVLIHESGHALTAHWLGGKVVRFAPYPQLVQYNLASGHKSEEWVLGLVQIEPFTDANAEKKQAWVSAMGSGTNLLSVFLFAPLLPELSSSFARNSLDNMLFLSCFDLPAYVLGDLITKSKTGDWTQVSKLTGVALPWYFALGMTASLLVNQYRYHWYKKALRPGEIDRGPLTVGFSTEF